MGFFRRFFTKKNEDKATDVGFEESEEEILEVLKKQYVVDVGEKVETIESILDDEEEKMLPADIHPAPDYDESDASIEDVLEEEQIERNTENKVHTQDSIEELGDHLNTARIIGDLPEEISFD